jgi:hypothetical protein
MLLAAPAPPIGPSRQATGAALMGEPRAIAGLFGASASTAGDRAAVAPATTAPSVPIQVIGVVAAGKRSSALLMVDGKPLRSYAVGDLIAPSVRLRHVGPASIILDDTGRERVLAAPAPTSPSVLGAAPPPIATGRR